MQTKIEGLLLKKTAFKERDLIAHLLLRNGKKISVIFFGGQGGGAKKKSSVLELGFMMSVVLRQGATAEREIYSAKEHAIVWNHEKIRFNHEAFYLLCFFLEVLEKVSASDDLQDEHREFDDHSEGIFKVGSNAVFYLEKSVLEGHFVKETQLFVFFVKLLIELGIFPQTGSCALCQKELSTKTSLVLSPERGGFLCEQCVNKNETSEFGKEMLELMTRISSMKYAEACNLVVGNKMVIRSLFNYFCYQFHFSAKDFLSASLSL